MPLFDLRNKQIDSMALIHVKCVYLGGYANKEGFTFASYIIYLIFNKNARVLPKRIQQSASKHLARRTRVQYKLWIFNLFIAWNAILGEFANKLKSFFQVHVQMYIDTHIKCKTNGHREEKKRKKDAVQLLYKRKTGGNSIDCTKNAITTGKNTFFSLLIFSLSNILFIMVVSNTRWKLQWKEKITNKKRCATENVVARNKWRSSLIWKTARSNPKKPFIVIRNRVLSFHTRYFGCSIPLPYFITLWPVNY